MDSLIQESPPTSKETIFKDTIINNGITHFIVFDQEQQVLQIASNSAIYLVDTLFVDKILSVEVVVRNAAKDIDLLIACDYDMAAVGHLYRLQKKAAKFEKVQGHEDYYTFVSVDEAQDLYCDYMSDGCNGETWTSFLYQIQGLKIVELGYISYDACDYYEDKSKFLVEVYKKKKRLLKTDDYESVLAKKIREKLVMGDASYWQENLALFFS